MPYFKDRPIQQIKRPVAHQVLGVQAVVMLVFVLIVGLFSILNGFAVLVGGLIAISGQAFYNRSALKYFGSPDTNLVLSSTAIAMWGKWLIVISATTAVAVTVKEFNAAVLYASVFGLLTLGSLLLPVLVKRAP
ncbi:hypothetical protein [Reinekea sp.]|jgi:hypothetical protein|uniref:hypothetical protein n=1 Tax=Reinekea sp. TaxID=1970455 RepID=UPI003989913C